MIRLYDISSYMLNYVQIYAPHLSLLRSIRGRKKINKNSRKPKKMGIIHMGELLLDLSLTPTQGAVP